MIDVYSDYLIKVSVKSDVISQEDSIPHDVAFSNIDDYTEEVVIGSVLLNIIRLSLSDDLISFTHNRNKLVFNYFDCLSGECCVKTITYIRKRSDN